MEEQKFDWQAHRDQQDERLRNIFAAVAEGETLNIDPECKNFVRLIAPAEISRRDLGKQLELAFSGGVYFGNPKFGTHEFVGGGVTATTNGTKGIFVDCYPKGRAELAEYSDEVVSAEQAVKDILEDERLMNQIQSYGFLEVQSSSGHAVNLEYYRPRVEIPALTR